MASTNLYPTTTVHHRRGKRRWPILVVALAAGIGIGVGIFFLTHRSSQPAETSSSEQTQTQADQPVQPTTTKPQQTTDTSTAEADDGKQNIQNEGQNPNTLEEITGALTYAAADAGMLTLRVNIDQFLVEAGTCQLTLTSGTNTYVTTVDTFTDPATSTCQGFDVPVTELGAGLWQIAIKISAGDKQGTITGSIQL